MATAPSKTRIKNTIYKQTQMLTSRMWSDLGWQAVQSLFAEIRNALASLGSDLNLIVSVIDGGYRENDMSKWKEYSISIVDGSEKQIFGGQVNAFAAGTMADPWSRYDMTLVLW